MGDWGEGEGKGRLAIVCECERELNHCSTYVTAEDNLVGGGGGGALEDDDAYDDDDDEEEDEDDVLGLGGADGEGPEEGGWLEPSPPPDPVR